MINAKFVTGVAVGGVGVATSVIGWRDVNAPPPAPSPSRITAPEAWHAARVPVTALASGATLALGASAIGASLDGIRHPLVNGFAVGVPVALAIAGAMNLGKHLLES